MFRSAWLCQQNSCNRNLSVVLHPSVRPSSVHVAIISEPNLTLGPVWIFKKSFFEYISFSLTWDSIEAKFKTLLLLHITVESYFATYPNFFFSIGLTKVLFWIFAILSFWLLTNFWNSPFYPMGKPKTSIILKTSDGVKFGSWGWIFSVYRVLLIVKWLFWGRWVLFRCSTTLYLEHG